MKIKLLANICGSEGSFINGKEVELSEKLATALIKDGHAVEVEEVEIVEVKPIEIIEPIEKTKPSKKYGGKK